MGGVNQRNGDVFPGRGAGIPAPLEVRGRYFWSTMLLPVPTTVAGSAASLAPGWES